MKNYLLTIIGGIESEEMCKDIAITMSPLVDSPNLKFQHKKNVLFLYFGTEVCKEELYEYVSGVFYGVVDTFVLTEVSDNVTVHMPEPMIGHLFDLESSDGDTKNDINMSRVMKNKDFLEGDDEEFISTMLKQLDTLKSRPSLDQILDKINNKGYESLTPFEQDTLENYSKN